MIYESNLRNAYLCLDEIMAEVVNEPNPEHPIAEWIFWSIVGKIINYSTMKKTDKQKCFSAVVHAFHHPPKPTMIYRSLLNDGQRSEYYALYADIQNEYCFSDNEDELGLFWQRLITDVKPYRLNRAVRWLDIFLSKDILDAIYLEIGRYERPPSNSSYIEVLQQCSNMLKEKIGILTGMRELPI